MPVHTTDVEPLDRRWVLATGVCVVGIPVVAVLLVVGPWASLTALLYAVFGLPFVSVPLGALWNRAYPEETDGTEERTPV